jgi:sulfide:quinone oxidoreductase
MARNEARVVIAGGGVAALESLLALADLAGDRAALTLVAPEPDFLYKPLLVEEPFGLEPAARHELEPLAAEKGANFVQHAIASVNSAEHQVKLDDGSTLDYDFLVVCTGGRFVPALEGAITFPSPEPFSPDRLLDRAEQADHRLAFVVPPGVT